MSLKLFKFPKNASKSAYRGQQVMGLLKMLRHSETKHRMCLKARNKTDELYNQFKIAQYLSNNEYTELLNLWWTYCMLLKVDKSCE